MSIYQTVASEILGPQPFETTCGNRHRVHVISGDGNRANLSTWLKFGCTALVVRMLDAGSFPAIGLADPVQAIKTFALDVNLDAKVECLDGCQAGIMKIQRWFLESAAAATDLFPEWAPRVIDEWGKVLDRFDSGGGCASLTDNLDWPAKRALFERVVERSGWTWERIGEVNALIDDVYLKLGDLSPTDFVTHIDLQEIHPGLASHFWQFMVRVQARRQREDELTDAVMKLEAVESDRLEFLWDSCNAHCHIGLAGHPAVRGLCEKVARELESWLFPRTSGVACWKYHVARWHNRNCRGAVAIGLLEPLLHNGHYDCTSHSVQAGILSQLGDARRMIGDLDGAERCLTGAETICRGSGLSANLWDLVMTGRARLLVAQGKREEAFMLLNKEIMPAQRRLGMPGWLRSKILMERISTEHRNPLRSYRTKKSLALDVNFFSGYARCPLMTRVLDHWDEWCEGGPDPAPPFDSEFTDFLWGV